MSVTLTFLGQSGFLIESGRHTLAVDPFLTGNPVAKHKPQQIKCTAIALSHGHEDHVGDTVAIAKANDCYVFAAFELCNYLSEQGIEKVNPGNPGGKIATDAGYIAFTQAFHSSSHDGRYMGMPCGLIINIDGVTIYHAGDTALFSDMKMIGELYNPDIALLPIGDRFTMGPEHATIAAQWIKPKVAIPMHYNTWPPIEQDPADFKPSGVEVKVMNPADQYTYG